MECLDATHAERMLAAFPYAVLLADACDPGFRTLYTNPAFSELAGGPPVLDAATIAVMAHALASGKRGMRQLRVEKRQGEASWCELQVTPLCDESGKVVQLLATWTDIGPLRACQEQLTFQANHDALTGLPNRAAFQARTGRALGHARRGGGALAVLYIGIDNFRRVNEALGHQAGDVFFAAIAHRLGRCARPGDTLARHDGDTFALLLGELAGSPQANALAEHVLASMDEPVKVGSQSIYASCSIGVAFFPRDADQADLLLRYADMALSLARGEGGKRIQFFTQQMRERAAERVQLEAALRLSIERSEFQLLYQPIADLQTGAICGAEALVRWQHPALGLVSAQRFIPVAEEAGLIGALGDWILRRALEDMRDWQRAGHALPRVSINVSPRQFRDRSLPQRIAAALAEFGIGPSQLTLEIQETVLMQDADTSEHTLAQLKELGIGVALDDFGTGYSSLSHLKRFPLDTVKIDGVLSRNVVTDAQSAALCKTVVAMAHHLGIAVTAEGVETEAQCDFLRRHMCDQVQGYFFGEPTDAAGMGQTLGRKHSLPPHLLRIQKQKRTLLLVDDETNIVSALKRLLRRDEYQILTAGCGKEALELMAQHEVDVIVSDQRMPGMLGADFLRAAKDLYPDTVRIMLSGYTELQSVTNAVNEGAIYKFLTKPWDDELLRGHIAEAFRLKEIADENERLNLELRTANQEMASTNRRMEEVLRQKQQQISRDEISLGVARELLQFMPLPVIGLDDDGMVAFVNAAGGVLLNNILGNDASMVLPELFPHGQFNDSSPDILIDGRRYRATVHQMGAESSSRGSLVTLEYYKERP